MTERSDSVVFPWETVPPASDAPAEAAHPQPEAPSDADALSASPANAGASRDNRDAIETGSAAEEYGSARRSERPLVRKEYYSISEVADLVGLPAHVLRYWESQFSVLNPSKNRSGNRVYQRKEIRLILLVKQLLYDEKYTVEGAKQKLEQLRRGGSLGEATTRALDTQLVRVMREDLRALLQILSPDNP